MCYSDVCGESDNPHFFLPLSRWENSRGWGREALSYTEFRQGIQRGTVGEREQESSPRSCGDIYICGWKIQTIKKIISGCLDLLL